MYTQLGAGDEAVEKKFIAEATAAGLVGLKGHRSVGGCRASIYNSVTMEDVTALVLQSMFDMSVLPPLIVILLYETFSFFFHPIY